jgi:hypothetical protein
MQATQDPPHAARREMRTARGTHSGGLPIAGVFVLAGLALSACGSSGPPRVLNTVKIEHAIEQGALAQRDKRIDVSCPSGVKQKKGLVFTCTAVFYGGHARFLVTEVDGVGDVHYAAE